MPARERPPRGRTPAGFRAQLLKRLRNRASEEQVEARRLQYRVAFERFLARIADERAEWMLKGGFALELRYGWRHRPTKDVDLRTEASLGDALARLRDAMTRGPQFQRADHFSFELGEPGPEMQGAPGGAWRVPVIARVAGEVFVTFHIDLSSGDAVVQPPDTREGSDILDFAGIPRIWFPIYPLTQQLAEKLHALTLPRTKANTRVKDLVDLMIIAAVERIDGTELMRSLRATFEARRSHDVPGSVPPPDRSWVQPFKRLTLETPASPITDLDEGFALVMRFWTPVLQDTVSGRYWDPGAGGWRA